MANLNVGDKVKVVNAMFPFGKYENGDVLTVSRIDEDPEFLFVEEHGTIMYIDEVELVVEEATEPLKVGDYAKVVGNWPSGINPGEHDFAIGQIVKLDKKATMWGDGFMCDSLDGKERWNVARKDLERVSVEEAHEPVKVGDYVVVTNSINEHKEGDVLKLVGGRSPSGCFEFSIHNLTTGRDRGYIDGENVRKATDAEVESVISKPEYETVKRHAKVGERILIVNANPINGQDFENGDVFTVTGLCSTFEGDVEVSGQPDMIDKREYEVISEPAPMAIEGTMKIEEGDLVRVEGHTSYFGVIEDGLDEDGEYFIVDGDGEGEYVDDKNVILVAKATDRKDQ
ncbi:hypothetical protein [Bacillus sp. 7894-2]|uniref:hypothetical protein n=1 Tax=Bacillus sp. 7894-2 TaxID=2021695 RepID=UPI000BA74DE0|nr:hypothetical protein [Bacillus sp. 7894-2]PAE24027.1 hypothetical protein CHI10_14575 [Bacillus sp. 7894-2]